MIIEKGPREGFIRCEFAFPVETYSRIEQLRKRRHYSSFPGLIIETLSLGDFLTAQQGAEEQFLDRLNQIFPTIDIEAVTPPNNSLLDPNTRNTTFAIDFSQSDYVRLVAIKARKGFHTDAQALALCLRYSEALQEAREVKRAVMIKNGDREIDLLAKLDEYKWQRRFTAFLKWAFKIDLSLYH